MAVTWRVTASGPRRPPAASASSPSSILRTCLPLLRLPAPACLQGGLGGRKLIVASEYETLTRKWMEKKGIADGVFLRAYGATESLPPEDADIIVDNAATGSTLKANSLEVFDTIMSSTTRMFASREAWENPAKR